MPAPVIMPLESILSYLEPLQSKADSQYHLVVAAFATDPQVTCADGKGFGAGALKVNGKIFAMMSSKGQFVVKLKKARVDELVLAGLGERFDPGHGRLMKEWFATSSVNAGWIELAREAHNFVRGR